MTEPLYANWHSLPFRVYLEAQKIVRDLYKPAEGRTVLAEIELVALLHGIPDSQLDGIPAEALPEMWQAVSAFALTRPPILEGLHEFEWQGINYLIDREPRDISLLQLKAIEEYAMQYPDEFDAALVHVALLVSPPAVGAYGKPGSPAPFAMDRAQQWQMVADWPTPVAYSLHAFFLRHWLRSKVLTPLSTAMEAAGNQAVTMASPTG